MGFGNAMSNYLNNIFLCGDMAKVLYELVGTETLFLNIILNTCIALGAPLYNMGHISRVAFESQDPLLLSLKV